MRFAREELQRTGLANGDKTQLAAPCGLDEFLRAVAAGIHNRHAIGTHDFREEAQLGGQIGFEILVIVEVIAREIGESRRRNIHAVQPELVEAVAGGFQRQMIDAVLFQLRENAMDFHRIRRGVLERDLSGRRDHADGTKARAVFAERRPDLP